MSGLDRRLVAGAAAALLLVAAAGWLLLTPAPDAAENDPFATDALGLASVAPSASSSATESASLVVDIEGGVLRPGVQSLPSGARIADALVAAGGYGPNADIDAAARDLNLAALLTDGQQVYVPVVGAAPAAASGAPVDAPGGGATQGGLVDLNTATPAELDALPGVGPVTVQKIVAARQERPFASLDEAAERGVLDRGQLEKIRDLATAG